MIGASERIATAQDGMRYTTHTMEDFKLEQTNGPLPRNFDAGILWMWRPKS